MRTSRESVTVRWVDEDPERYGPLQRGDRVCIRRPSGTHFVEITHLPRANQVDVAPETVCGELIPREEWPSSPLCGTVDCQRCLVELEEAAV